MSRALIFDYDGLIFDTETPEFYAWREIYQDHGMMLELADWTSAVGWVNNFDPKSHLENLLGKKLDWTTLDQRRRQRHHQIMSKNSVLPGVETLIQKGIQKGYRIGIASNSNSQWVESGLERLGLIKWVHAIRTRDRVEHCKPHPAPYLKVLEDLGAKASMSYAFEDSYPGIVSAKAAGLKVIAVPNAITRHQNLSSADSLLESLEHFPFESL